VRFRIEQRFVDPLEAVEAALVDPAFLARLASLPNLGRPQLLDQRTEGPITSQRARYAFVGELSGAVRAVVDPERLTWVEVSKLNRSTHVTDFRIVPDNYGHLLECHGTFALRGASAGCVRLAEGEVRVSVPLLGRRVEAAIVSGLEEHAALESSVMAEWLAGQASAG
jgi:hypothetical protein